MPGRAACRSPAAASCVPSPRPWWDSPEARPLHYATVMDAATAFAHEVPSASEAYAWSWPTLKRFFVELLLLAITWMALACPVAIARHAGAPLLAAAWGTLVVVPLNFGALRAYLEAVRERTPRFAHLFQGFGPAYPQIIL